MWRVMAGVGGIGQSQLLQAHAALMRRAYRCYSTAGRKPSPSTCSISLRSSVALMVPPTSPRAFAENGDRLLLGGRCRDPAAFPWRRGSCSTAPDAGGYRCACPFRPGAAPPRRPAPDRYYRRPAGCARPPPRGSSDSSPPVSVTAISVKSVVPPPISTTRIRSPRLDALAPVGMPLDPGVEGRLRLFEQRDVLIAGLLGGFQRQFARHGIERSRHRDQHLLLGERRVGHAGVPGLAQMLQVAAAGFHRRDLVDAFRRAEGQQRRGAVHAGMREPRFGRRDQAADVFRRRASAPAGPTTKSRAGVPGQRDGAGRKIGRARQVEERGQQVSRRALRRDSPVAGWPAVARWRARTGRHPAGSRRRPARSWWCPGRCR